MTTGEVTIPVDAGAEVAATLAVPSEPIGVVVFAHGSGSSRLSPRNQQVASVLQDAGIATVLLDLLTSDEAHDRDNVFDIRLLGRRLVAAIAWVRSQPALGALPVGLFGASTGAAAALVASASADERIAAVVSRGGRPDLAGEALRDVAAPTLLIVGGRDEVVLDLNVQARTELGGPSLLEVVEGATHLFEERGALERVAELATTWFVDHFDGSSGGIDA